jgi:hypothetical protein
VRASVDGKDSEGVFRVESGRVVVVLPTDQGLDDCRVVDDGKCVFERRAVFFGVKCFA